MCVCRIICLQDVGCDYGIDSNAVEDRCGVCLGDGKSCEMVYKSFDEEEGLGESRTKRAAGIDSISGISQKMHENTKVC